MPIPEIVLFDIGNVLIEWQPERFFDRIMPPEDRKRMFATVDLHAMNDCIDRGGDFRTTIYETADRHPEFTAQIRLWHDRWIDLATPAIPRSAALNRALRTKGITTAILSNIGHKPFVIASTRYPFLDEFDHHFLSGPLQTIKPEPQIYAAVEAHFNRPANRLLFADDRIENINAAHARGWRAHHFTSAQGWAETLVTLGLLTEQEAAFQ
ncbi:MAG: HAD-IA family hydrolase [Alphaproteobacteria bacterium]|nr:HAD-IA family hydrolase [Alphaproteobacteria bacterium]